MHHEIEALTSILSESEISTVINFLSDKTIVYRDFSSISLERIKPRMSHTGWINITFGHTDATIAGRGRTSVWENDLLSALIAILGAEDVFIGRVSSLGKCVIYPEHA